MTIATIHLHLTPYPAPTPRGVIDFACAVAKLFEATLEVSSSRLSIQPVANVLTAGLVEGMAHQLESATAEISDGLEAYLEAQGVAFNLTVRVTKLEEGWPGTPSDAWRGRTSDLCILPLSQDPAEAHFPVDDWLYQAGRPCLLYPPGAHSVFAPGRVLVCWDNSHTAARAVGDALPFLHNATDVRVVVFRGEKDAAPASAATALVAYLQAHGVRAGAAEVDIAGQSIGSAILDHAEAIHADLIVMGAFGHHPLQEMLLGGATREIFAKTKLPVLASH